MNNIDCDHIERCEHIGSAAERSSSVNSRLNQRHQEMEDLSDIRALLVKLQAVFELPQRLRFAQQQGAIELAADKYSEVSELLKIYGHKVANPILTLLCLP